MITQKDFYEIAKNNPELMRAYYNAVQAIIDLREEVAKNQSGLWASARLRKKEFSATFQVIDIGNRLIFNGQPISEEEKKLVQRWIINAANYHMMPKEEQHKALMRDLENARQADQPG
jgi:hypothetical protein